MGLLTRFRAAKNSRSLIAQIRRARDRVPYQELEQLIGLCRGYAAAREALFEDVDAQIADGGDDLSLAWLLIASGELGREGLVRVLHALYRGDGDASWDAALPILSRGAAEVLPELLREIHREPEPSRRLALYEALEGATVAGNEAVRQRLLLFARERYEVEKADPAGAEILHAPLVFLASLGHPETRQLVAAARPLCQGASGLAAELDDVEAGLAGADLLSVTRERMPFAWRSMAERIGTSYLGSRSAENGEA